MSRFVLRQIATGLYLDHKADGYELRAGRGWGDLQSAKVFVRTYQQVKGIGYVKNRPDLEWVSIKLELV